MKQFCYILLVLVPLFASAQNPIPDESFFKKCDAYGAAINGISSYSQGEKDKALIAYSYALIKDPTYARAHFYKGTILLEQAKYKESEKLFLKSLELEPSFFFAYYNLACVAALDNRPKAALKYADLAMSHGYNRYQKFHQDADLKSIHGSPELAKLIKAHQEKKAKLNTTQKFLLGDFEAKVEIINALTRKQQDDWNDVTQQALMDSDYRVRVGGIILLNKYGTKPQKLQLLTRSLFEGHGRVNKTAGNALVNMGADAIPYMDAILKSKHEHPKFFAKQVKALILHLQKLEADSKKPLPETPKKPAQK